MLMYLKWIDLISRITWMNQSRFLGLDQNIGIVVPHYRLGLFYIFDIVLHSERLGEILSGVIMSALQIPKTK